MIKEQVVDEYIPPFTCSCQVVCGKVYLGEGAIPGRGTTQETIVQEPPAAVVPEVVVDGIFFKRGYHPWLVCLLHGVVLFP